MTEGAVVSEEFERLVAEYEKFQAKIESAEHRFADLDQMRAEIVAIEASVTSADRSVTVVAGAGGAVRDIRFTEDAMRQSASSLGGIVLSTVHQAVAAAAREQAALVERYHGDDMQLMDQGDHAKGVAAVMVTTERAIAEGQARAESHKAAGVRGAGRGVRRERGAADVHSGLVAHPRARGGRLMGNPSPAGGGYTVDVPALEGYVGTLGNYREQSGTITSLVGKADVGDQSWGLVGLATKGSYTETLHALQELLDAMTDGLKTATDKVSDAAATYRGNEDDHMTMFNEIRALLDGPRP